MAALATKADFLALSCQAGFSEPSCVTISHVQPLHNADRSGRSSEWASFCCFRQPSSTSEPQQEPGQLFWRLSPAVTGRRIIIKREMAQHADESLTNAAHGVQHVQEVASALWFGKTWPLKSIFTAVSALLLQPQVSASIPKSLAAGLSAVSRPSQWLTVSGIEREGAKAPSNVYHRTPGACRWRLETIAMKYERGTKPNFSIIHEVTQVRGEKMKWCLCNGEKVWRGKHALASLIPFHNTAARSPRWRHWAGRAGTKTRWCCQRCGSPGAWWILWMELQEAQGSKMNSRHRYRYIYIYRYINFYHIQEILFYSTEVNWGVNIYLLSLC